MNTDEALADAQWHIDHGTRPSVETTIALMAEIAELCRKLLNAELQQQTTEDRVISALDSLATWRERAERAEAENYKLRDAWPSRDNRQNIISDGYSGKFFTYGDWQQDGKYYDTRDAAINAAAGIDTSTKEGE